MTATAMPRSSRAWAAAVPASAPASPRHFPIFSKTCSAWPGSADAAADASAAPTCATIWKSRWRKPTWARPRRSRFRSRSPASPVRAPAPRPAPIRRPVRWAAALATHEFFQRDGADLHCRVPISMVAAALGGEFEVPTIDKGKTKVKVPAGTQSGRRFRIASKGMPVLRSRQTGDMYVQVMVETPQNLTKKQQELLAEFEKLSSGATQPEAAGFFTKVKDFFGNRAGS